MAATKTSAANPFQDSIDQLAEKGRTIAAGTAKAAAEAVEAAHGETLHAIDAAIALSKSKSPEQSYEAFSAYFSALGVRATERAKSFAEGLSAGFPGFFAPVASKG